MLQGIAPARLSGTLLTHNNDLYVYGGPPAFYLEPGYDRRRDVYTDGDAFMLKLNPSLNKWEPASSEGAPPVTWREPHIWSSGMSPDICVLHLQQGRRIAKCLNNLYGPII